MDLENFINALAPVETRKAAQKAIISLIQAVARKTDLENKTAGVPLRPSPWQRWVNNEVRGGLDCLAASCRFQSERTYISLGEVG